MLDDVMKELDVKSAHYSHALPVHNIREVSLFVNEWDAPAQEYCERLKKCTEGINHILDYPIRSGEQIEQVLNELSERAYDSEEPVEKSQYFLYITSDLNSILNVNYEKYRRYFQSLEYELLYITRLDRTPKKLEGFMRNLMVSPGDICSGLMLIMEGAASFPRVSPRIIGFSEESHWYRLRTKEFNAVREDIFRQIYSRLCKQLMGDDIEIVYRKLNDLERRFSQEISSICNTQRQYPTAWELPYIGYETVCERFQKHIPQRHFAGRPVKTGINIAFFLSLLFGKEGDISRTEVLRRELAQKGISCICRKMIQDKEPELVGLLLNNFTLHDLYSHSGIADMASSRKNYFQRMAEKEEQILLQYINNTEFLTSSLAPEDLNRGLSNYYSLWNSFITCCVWKEWWGEISVLISEMDARNAKEYKELTDIFREACRNIDTQNVPLSIMNPIRSKNDVINCIRNASAARTYSKKDLENLIERETRKTIALDGDNGDSRLRAKMCLFGNRDVVQRQSYVKKDLNWLVRPTEYVQRSMCYVMRMYAVLEEEEGSDDSV